MTLEILICTHNKGIVKISDMLLAPAEGVRYIVSFQYTEESYLSLIPEVLRTRSDVKLLTIEGKGISVNRNHALSHASSDLILFADDDARYNMEAFDLIRKSFLTSPTMDIAFFQATTYTDKLLKDYPTTVLDISQRSSLSTYYTVSAIEMVCRRKKVQGTLHFDTRFGLGTPVLTCGEEDIWLEDARRAHMHIAYIPKVIVSTSTLLKKSMLYVDAGVQRSYAAKMYYIYGSKAWYKCFAFAFSATRTGMTHFLPMMRHFSEGIAYFKRLAQQFPVQKGTQL